MTMMQNSGGMEVGQPGQPPVVTNAKSEIVHHHSRENSDSKQSTDSRNLLWRTLRIQKKKDDVEVFPAFFH